MKLLIFAGSGKDFGTGHETRMRDLQALLEPASSASLALLKSQSKVARGLARSVQKFTKQTKAEPILCTLSKAEEALQELAKINKNSKGTDSFLFLLDARELDPYPFLEKGSVLTLDNYHPARYIPQRQAETKLTRGILKDIQNKLQFHDTLPHPYSHSHLNSHSQKDLGNLSKILKQALISPYLLDRREKEHAPRQQKKALVCAGAFEELPEFLALFSKFDEILWLGKKSKDRRLWPFLSFQTRVSRLEFWDYLSRAQMVFCYPGMVLLEAWFLAKTPILFATESKIHNELSAYLSEKARIPYLTHKGRNCQEFFKAYRESQAFLRKASFGKGPSGEGYTILLQKLQSLKSRAI